MDIVEQFAVNPYLTIKKIAEELDIAYSTAERGVQKLIRENIIHKVGGNKRDKVFCAIDILSILEEPAKIYSDFPC
ncbi:MAG: winged helix-turn-helix transcriptional regulator [Chlamydiota bacterium]